MNKKFIRIIPRLDIKNGQLIKGINLEGLRILGDPLEYASYYYKSLADEIFYVDNVATLYGTNNLNKFISRTSKKLFIPMSVGGGIRSLHDIESVLNNGADKVCINSAAIDNQKFLKEAVQFYGSSTISILIETIKINNKYFISKSNGRDLVNLNPLDWALKAQDIGVGEVFLTSVNNEGLRSGFDISITQKISNRLDIPVVAHGGAGSKEDIFDVVSKTDISGVSVASLLHYNTCGLFKIKKKNIGNFEFLESQKKKE